MVIVRIENINDQFCKVFLLYCFVIISSVKFIKFKVCDRFCIPYTQCIYYVIAYPTIGISYGTAMTDS